MKIVSAVLTRASDSADAFAGGSSTAATVTFAPAGSVAATNVQAAITELDTDKASLSGATFTGLVNFAPSTAGGAGFNIGAPGTPPTTKAEGDMWLEGTLLKYWAGAGTRVVMLTGGGTFTGAPTFRAGTTVNYPFNFQAGVLMTTPIAHAAEWDNTAMWLTDSGGTRRKIAYVNDITSNTYVFTTSTAGTVPASGGGTTNFLRADGTWAAAGGGSSDPLPLATEVSTDAPVSGTPATGVNLFSSVRANRRMPAYISPTGRTERLQPFIGSNDIMMVDVLAGGAAYSYVGASMQTDVGTVTLPNISTTNLLTMQNRKVISVAATANLMMEAKAAVPWCSRRLVGGGFHFTMRFGLETVLPATGRLYAGLNAVSTAIPSADPSNILNSIALIKNSGTSVLSIMSTPASTANQVTFSLPNTGGVGWNVAGTMFQLELFCRPGDTGIGYRVTRYTPGATPSTSAPVVTYDEGYASFPTYAATNFPIADTLFIPHLWAQNVAATATSIAFIQMYKESD